jgi:hypothetical protein
MDLNIGTAFWFASRGKGFLYNYSSTDEKEFYSCMNDHGRPLVRIGEEGDLLSKGRSVENEEMKALKEKIPCFNPKCNAKTFKYGCERQLCQRCCDKYHKEQLYQQTEDKSSLRDLEIHNPCPIHQSVIQSSKEPAVEKGKKKKNKLQETNDEGNEAIHNSLEGIEDEQEGIAFQSSLVIPEEQKIPYQSTAKVLLVGLGADEQLAGYGRHRTVFQHGGNEALCEELNKDLKRLWQRNLGR